MLTIVQSELGAAIETKRKALGMTRAQLARVVGVSYQAAYDWERRGAVPKMEHYSKLAEVLGLSLGDAKTPDPSDALSAFLGTPQGKALSKVEVAILRSIDWQGNRPSPAAYSAIAGVVRIVVQGATSPPNPTD